MRGFPALVLQLLDALMLFSAMLPDGTSKLDLCLGNTVPQAPDRIIRQMFHEKRDKLSVVQSQVTSFSNFQPGPATSSPSRSIAKRSRATDRTCGCSKPDPRRTETREVAGTTRFGVDEFEVPPLARTIVMNSGPA